MTDLNDLGITTATAVTIDWFELGAAIANDTPQNQAEAITGIAAGLRYKHNGITDLVEQFNDDGRWSHSYAHLALWLANALADNIRPEVQEPTA